MAETIAAPLKGKVAIVTGGSRGIGASIAQVFARQGVTHLATTYVSNKAKAEEVLEGIKKEYPNVKTFTFAADVCDVDFGSQVVDQTLKGLGVDHIDIVVSNAAPVDVASWPPIADLPYETYRKVVTGLSWGPVDLSRKAITHMPKGGRIIMLSSGSSKIAAGDPFTPYAAGKAAMEAASKQLAAMYGVKYGVTVNTIGVGATETDAFAEGGKFMGEGFREYAANFSLLKRVADPVEVAEIVAFVASPQAGWITGNQIPANGGGLAMMQS